MTETRTVAACAECQVLWHVGSRADDADGSDHSHRQLQVHRHLSPLVPPDGTRVAAGSFDPVDPYSLDHAVDYGLYLDRRWSPQWLHNHIDWPDFGVPDDPPAALGSPLARAGADQRLEVSCLGGHQPGVLVTVYKEFSMAVDR